MTGDALRMAGNQTGAPMAVARPKIDIRTGLNEAAVPMRFEDGRQSAQALLIRRGTGRLLRMRGFALVPEVTLRSGRRADLLAVNRTGEIWIVEIKSSIEDFRTDRKWPDYAAHADRLFFATGPDVPLDIFPAETGLILADGYGADIVRDAPCTKLSAARRKEVTIRFARTAAHRLHDLDDPARTLV